VLSGHFNGRSERIRKANFEVEVLGQECPATFVCMFVFVATAPPRQWAMASSFTRFLDHTQRRFTFGRTSLDEWSANNTQHSQQTDVHEPRGIRTHNLSRPAATDLRLRPRGHWDRPPVYNNGNYYLTEMLCLLCLIVWPFLQSDVAVHCVWSLETLRTLFFTFLAIVSSLYS